MQYFIVEVHGLLKPAMFVGILFCLKFLRKMMLQFDAYICFFLWCTIVSFVASI